MGAERQVSKPPFHQGEAQTTVITVIGTNDTHGQLERVAVLSGYMQAIRAVREAAGWSSSLEWGRYVAGTPESNPGGGLQWWRRITRWVHRCGSWKP